MRSQPTAVPPSPELGKVSELIRSLLVTGEFRGVSPMFLYSVNSSSSTKTQERFYLKMETKTCTASCTAEALFFD